MQRSGGGAFSREIIVNSRRPLIPIVIRFELTCADAGLGNLGIPMGLPLPLATLASLGGLYRLAKLSSSPPSLA